MRVIRHGAGMAKAPDITRLETRLPPELAERLEGWRKRQTVIPSRTDAVRHLLDVGLDADAEIARLRALLAAAGVDPDVPP